MANFKEKILTKVSAMWRMIMLLCVTYIIIGSIIGIIQSIK